MAPSSIRAFCKLTALTSSLCHALPSAALVRRRHDLASSRALIHDASHESIKTVPEHRHHQVHYPHGKKSFAARYTTTSTFSSRTDQEVRMTCDAMEILKEAIAAVDPARAVQRHVRVVPTSGGDLLIGSAAENTNDAFVRMHTYHAQDFDNVLILAFGKASSAMAAACVQQLKEHQQWARLPMDGLVIVKDDHGTKEEYDMLISSGITILSASHPVPDERSVDGARKIIKLANEKANDKTFVFCCISGGGSSLFCDPLLPLSLQELQATNSILLASGLSINEMNIVRKRLETGKGGRLAAALYPATLVTLVLSDILGDPLDLIASGPTVPDASAPSDAWQLIQRNPVLRDELPSNVLQLIQGQVQDNDIPLDASHAVFAKTVAVLVGNNEKAVMAAADEASKLGYNPVILGTRIEGEARHVAGVYVALAQSIGGPYSMIERPAALIAGGETTVTLPPNHSGKGGRNQELALAAALRLNDLCVRNVVLASVGTDGTDGPTDAAGAVVDGGTIQRMPGSADDALQQHNAYEYLKEIEVGDDSHCPLIMTGPTGTNVADMCVILIR